MGRVDESLQSYEHALELNPNDTECWFEFAETLFENGRMDDALAGFDKAIAQEPEWSEAHYGRARVLLAMGKMEEMAAPLRKAFDLDPRLRDEFLSAFPGALELKEVQDVLSATAGDA
jgi:tetratricopeptide (TPR) repeat protein